MEQQNKEKQGKLERLTSRQIHKGMLVVSFEYPATIWVGKVYGEVTRHPLLTGLLSGIFAEFDLLCADQHMLAGDLIWQQYFYLNRNAPTDSGVFRWPDVMPLTFRSMERNLKRGWRGCLIHVEVRSPHLGQAIVLQ